MEIVGKQPFIGSHASVRTVPDTSGRSEGAQSFASFLKVRGDTVQTTPVSAGDSQDQPQSAAEEDIEFIRQNGFQAYLERNHERKLEEMREQILRRMGLDEESLAAMSAEQRALIEKMVAEEIQARLAAEAEMNGRSGRNEIATAGEGDSAQNPLVFLDSPGRMQAMVGFSIIDAATGRADADAKPGDRQFLPGRDPSLPFL